MTSTPTRPVVRVTDQTTRVELEEAMTNIVATLRRMPAHWVDRRAALHKKLDALLGDWVLAGSPADHDPTA